MMCPEALKIINGRHPADWKPKDIAAIVKANVAVLKAIVAEAVKQQGENS